MQKCLILEHIQCPFNHPDSLSLSLFIWCLNPFSECSHFTNPISTSPFQTEPALGRNLYCAYSCLLGTNNPSSSHLKKQFSPKLKALCFLKVKINTSITNSKFFHKIKDFIFEVTPTHYSVPPMRLTCWEAGGHGFPYNILIDNFWSFWPAQNSPSQNSFQPLQEWTTSSHVCIARSWDLAVPPVQGRELQ